MFSATTFRISFQSQLSAALAAALLLVPGALEAQTLFLLSNSSVLSFNLSTDVATPGFTTITGLNDPIDFALSANALYVTNFGNGTITAYNATTGAPLAGFATITDPGGPYGITASGGDLYVSNRNGNTISAYKAATGAPDASFTSPSGLILPDSVAAIGGNLYVGDRSGTGMFGYDAVVKSFSLATGVATPGFSPIDASQFNVALAVSGNKLYFSNAVDEFVAAYDATTGAPLAGFTDISILQPTGLAVAGNTLYVSSNVPPAPAITAYDATSGAPIPGYTSPPDIYGAQAIAITAPAPEPTSTVLLGLGSLLLTVRRRRKLQV